MNKAGKVRINLTLRYVRVAIVVEKQQLVTYSECVSVTQLSSVQCACDVLYCHLSAVRL